MRSVSHVLTAIIAHEAKEYTRKTIRNVVVRPDDILEIMACYKTFYGKPFPNAMKREIASIIKKFNEYSIAKYNSDKKSITFKDVLRITHPTPNNETENELFNKIINDNLETPYTWETELSAKGNTKEVWEELIDSGKVGYMALLRNLRNIIKVCDIDHIKKVLNKIASPEEVKKSRQLPFRFYSAYKELEIAGYEETAEAEKYLNAALTSSVSNLPKLNGRTLIAIDKSGSMSAPVSSKSRVSCYDIARVLGCMSAWMCEDATVIYFDSNRGYNAYNMESSLIVKKYGKYDSILDSIAALPYANGGTDMSLPMRWALNKDRATRPFDRIIYFSDNECNYGRNTVYDLVNKYRQKKNPNVFTHMVDLLGYGTQQFYKNDKKFNLIAGWGDTVLEFISLAEEGIDSLVKRIESYSVV